MKNLIFPLCALFLIISCSKDDYEQIEDLEVSERSMMRSVTICHRKGNGTYKLKNVNQSSLPAHLGHGDVYPDTCFDDGYYMTADCVIIEVVEICGDGLDNDCDGVADEDCIVECEQACCWCDYLGSAVLTDACYVVQDSEEVPENYWAIFFDGLGLEGIVVSNTGYCWSDTSYEYIGTEASAACIEYIINFIEESEIPECGSSLRENSKLLERLQSN